MGLYIDVLPADGFIEWLRFGHRLQAFWYDDNGLHQYVIARFWIYANAMRVGRAVGEVLCIARQHAKENP